MKIFVTFTLTALMALVTLLFIRATTHFKDKQYAVDQPIDRVVLDEDGAVARFAASIRFPTISFDQTSQVDEQAFSGFVHHLQDAFPLVHQNTQRTLVNNFSLIFHLAGSDPTLKPALFMGHHDVVPIDESTQDKWRYPPFSGAVVDGEIWGRGTIDNKISVLALMEALELLLSQGVRPQRSVYFAFGHDEEIGGAFGAQAIASRFAAQGIQFEFVLDEGGVITEGIIPGVDSPVALVGVAEKGFVNVRLTANSEGGHSSQPPKSTTAGIIAQALVNIEQNPFPAELTFFNLMFDAVGFSTPLGTRLPMANLWLFSPLVKQSLMNSPSTAATAHTTTAVTMLRASEKSNVLPTKSEAVVNFRILPGDTVESVRAHVEKVVNDHRVKLETYMAGEASEISPTDSFGFKLIEQSIRKLDNRVLVSPYLVLGATDARHFSALSDNIYRFVMVRLNKESLKRFHGLNERVSIEDYLNAVQFFYTVLKQTAENAQID